MAFGVCLLIGGAEGAVARLGNDVEGLLEVLGALEDEDRRHHRLPGASR